LRNLFSEQKSFYRSVKERDQCNDDQTKKNNLKIILDPGDFAQKIADKCEKGHPNGRANNGILFKDREVERYSSCKKGNVSPDYREETTNND
jgi:hypothetical protein